MGFPTTQRGGDTMGMRKAVAIAVAAEKVSPSPGRSPAPCTNSLGHFWATSIDHCGMEGCTASFCEVPECLLVWPCTCTRGYRTTQAMPLTPSLSHSINTT